MTSTQQITATHDDSDTDFSIELVLSLEDEGAEEWVRVGAPAADGGEPLVIVIEVDDHGNLKPWLAKVH